MALGTTMWFRARCRIWGCFGAWGGCNRGSLVSVPVEMPDGLDLVVDFVTHDTVIVVAVPYWNVHGRMSVESVLFHFLLSLPLSG